MSAESQAECPLCMEPLELDDINFFPCTCGYQVCRFCWHRIRTDENGLCPACRKCYTEDPAEFKPIPSRDLQKMLKDKKQKDSQKRQKAAENRKHLTNVRVLQNNLVFVVGLSKRLADAAVLKKHTNFGKFGKIHKVVVNQSTTYAGSQGPSASAYITYYKSDDAIRAIQSVNNVLIDGRMVKASLGTTKYCSYYLRGLSCPKSDCMYLHELGDSGASFTKEQMQQGKHLEYEQMLHDAFKAAEKATCSVPSHLPDKTPSIKAVSVQNASKASSRKSIPVRKSLSRYSSRSAKLSVVPSVAANKFESMEMLEASNNQRIAKEVISQKIVAAGQHNHEGVPKSAGFPSRQLEDGQPFTDSCQHPCNENNCNMLIDDPSDDITDNTQDDDLGFDPWDESSRGLADMMEKENEHLRNSFVTPSKITTNLCSNSIGKTSSSRQGSISNRVPTLPLQNSLSLSTHGCLSQDYPAYNLRSGLQQSNAACSRTGRQTNHHMGAGRQSNQTINHEYHAFKQQANNNIQKNVTGLPSNTGCHQVAPPVHKHPFNIPNWIMTSKQKAPNTRPDHLNRGWIAFTQAFD